ncbi:MAG: hypothetical protein C1941_02445 [Prosthecochloris sp.]|nr:hypothetical protein [Prosthecochloris sp.]
MDDGSLRETDVWISQGGLTFRELCRMTLPPVTPVPFLLVIPVLDTGIHSSPAKPHGCRIKSGMTFREDGCRIKSGMTFREHG